MKHALLLGKLLNKSQLILPEYMHTVCRVLQDRGSGIELPDGIDEFSLSKSPTKRVQLARLDADSRVSINADFDDGVNTDIDQGDGLSVAMVPIMGALAQRGGHLQADSTVLRGYNEIVNDVYVAMQDRSVGGVALMIDSPGGELAGCFESCHKINDFRSRFDKPIWAFVDESAYSAAYALASTADRIVTTHSGGAGSIGVVSTHASFEKAAKDAGVKITYIISGKHKADGNPYKDLSRDVLNRWQAEIDYHYNDFVELVSSNRGLSEDVVRDTEAQTLLADEALEVGLIDSIGSIDDALSEFVNQVNADQSDTNSGTSGSVVSVSTVENIENHTTGSVMDISNNVDAVESNGVEGDGVVLSASSQTTGSSAGDSSSIHDRYQRIMTHPSAVADPETGLLLASEENLSIESALSILDRHSVAASGGKASGGSESLPEVLKQNDSENKNAHILSAVMNLMGGSNTDLVAITGDSEKESAAPTVEESTVETFRMLRGESVADNRGAA